MCCSRTDPANEASRGTAVVTAKIIELAWGRMLRINRDPRR